MIYPITPDNYSRFADLLYWRAQGTEGTAPDEPVPAELSDPNLYVYAAEAEGRFVGWISLCYIPKVSRWKKGHVYVDELWVAPEYRRRGIGRALMSTADKLKETLEATGIRLYVNHNSPEALSLYRSCGYTETGSAYFMEK